MQAHSEKITALVRWLVTLSAVLLLGCPPEPPTDPRPELVKRGEALFPFQAELLSVQTFR